MNNHKLGLPGLYKQIWKHYIVHLELIQGYINCTLITENVHIWISSNEVDETGAYYTEWSKSERKTSIQYINTYMWNLERW